MSMLLYDIRRGKKFTISMIVALLLFFTLALGFLAFWNHYLNPTRDAMGDDGLPKTPLVNYVPATYETFACLADGPTDCGRFEQYVESVSASPVAFTYDPFTENDPGKVNADGTRTIKLDSTVSPDDWQSVGVAVTQGRTLDGAQIDVSTVSVEGSVATAQVPKTTGSASASATISFEFSGDKDDPSSVRVTGVTYDNAEAQG